MRQMKNLVYDLFYNPILIPKKKKSENSLYKNYKPFREPGVSGVTNTTTSGLSIIRLGHHENL